MCGSAIFMLVLFLIVRAWTSSATNLHDGTSNMRNILQQATQAIENLVPEYKYSGWQEEMLAKADLLMRSIKQDYNPTRRERREIGGQSLTLENSGIFILQGTKKTFATGAKYPTDINIFVMKNKYQENQWYTVTLEAHKNSTLFADTLVIYKYQVSTSSFNEVAKVEVQSAVDVEVFTIHGEHYLAVAEHAAGDKPLEGSLVYRMMLDDTDNLALESVQTLNTKYPWDITVWEHMNQVFLAVAQGYSNQSLVFQWLGGHFDLICTVPTSDARHVHSFNIGSSMFLAFANHQPRPGYPEAYSEIFKYNLHDNKFDSHQKIHTFGAMDIHVFCFQNEKTSETFMVVANFYDNYIEDKTDFSESVIYKLVDDYFVPFQSVYVPAVTHWEPMAGPNGEFVLLGASRLHGVRPVQYDGWRFVETDMKLVDDSIEYNISSIRTLDFLGQQVIAVASKNNDGAKADILELQFSHENIVKQFHEDLLDWCKSSLKNVEQQDVKQLLFELENAPKINTPLLQIEGNPQFESLTIGELAVDSLQTKDGTINGLDIIHKLNYLHSDIQELNKTIISVSQRIEKAVKFNEDIHVPGKLILGNVTFTNSNNDLGNNVHIRNLNGENFVDFLDKTVDTRTELNYQGALEFEHISTTNMTALSINEVKVEDLVAKDGDIHLQHPLTILGQLQANDGVTVQGKVEGFEEFQVSSNGSLYIPKINIQNLELSILNDIKLRQMSTDEDDTTDTQHFEKIFVDNIEIDGLLSGINLEDLKTKYLTNSGDQVITGPITFDSLIVGDHCDIGGLVSGVSVPHDLVMINEGTMQVNQLQFTSPLSVNNISVLLTLNSMPVQDQLPFLRLDTERLQRIRGNVTIANLHVAGYCNIQGDIFGLNYNSTENHEYEDISINDSMLLNGKVQIIDSVEANNVIGKNISVAYLLLNGLKLNEEQIDVPLHFESSGVTKIEMLNATKINGFDPNQWLHQSVEETSIITGEKIFTDNLHFHQPITVSGLINGLNIVELDQDILKTTGDQIIVGHKTFNNVEAESIKAQDTWIGTAHWSNILTTSKDQRVTGTKIIRNTVNVKEKLDVQNMQVQGMVSGINITELLRDSIFHHRNSSKLLLKGTKTFEALLESEHFNSPPNHAITAAMPKSAENSDTLVHVGDINFKVPVEVEHLSFQGTFNSISDEDFGHVWLTSDGPFELKGNQIINAAVVNEVITQSGLISGIDFKKIAEKALYIDHDIHLKTATFEGGLSIPRALQLDGQLGGINLDDIVLSNTNNTITGTKTFMDTVVIENLGSTIKISEIDLHQMCRLVFSDSPGSLHVKGSVLVENEPIVTENFNDYEMSGILENVWFADKDTIIPTWKHLENLEFLNKVTVQGLLNGIDVERLQSNYFSKSMDQKIPAAKKFEDAVTFRKDLYSKTARVSGEVGGMILQDFQKQVLIDGINQTVIENLVFDTIYAQGNIELQGLVNGLDINKDIMLLSRGATEVDGHTRLHGLNCEDIYLSAGATIQNVDIVHWAKQAVRMKGDFELKGVKRFHAPTFNKLQVSGMVNKGQFSSENILIEGLDQEVTGQKTFVSENGAQALNVKQLNVTGLINNLDFGNFCKNIAYKDSDILFSMPKNISAPIHSQFAHILGTYQGVNISTLHPELFKPINMKKIEATLNQLMETARAAERSLKNQAKYLSHYKLVKTLPKPVEKFIPLFTNDTNIQLVLLTPSTSSIEKNFDIIEWRNKTKSFEHLTGSRKNHSLSYAWQLFPGLQSINPHGKQVSFVIKNTDCALILNEFDGQTSAKIFCQGKSFQDLPVFNPTQVAALQVDEIPYLILVHKSLPGHQESNVSIWKLQDNQFQLHQVLDIVNAVGVATGSHRHLHFLAIASGLLQQAAHQGNIHIMRLEPNSEKFTPWVKLTVTAPTALSFANLPTGELVLYVLCNDQASPLLVFIYQGEEGFKLKTRATTVSVAHSLNAFTFGKRHFVTLAGAHNGQILEAKFKGVY